MLETEAQAHNLYSVPTTWVEKSSGVNPLSLQTNLAGLVETYIGTPPIQNMPTATAPDFIEYRDWIIRSFFEFLGISTTNAQAQPPPGITSGVGLREYEGQVSDRWTRLSQDQEEFFVKIGETMLALVREEGGGKYAVNAITKEGMTEIKLGEIELTKDQFKIQCWPTSQLPQTPAARKQYVVELRQDNAIDDDTMQELLNLPDIKSYTKNRLAKRDYVKKITYKMIHDGEYTAPDEMIADAYPFAVEYMTNAYAQGLTTKVPDKHLQLIRQYLGELKAKMAPPAPPPGAGAAPNPIAKGAPPPVADFQPIGAKPGA